MSSGAQCPCQASWHVDTKGHHRDPINNEKSWLDFAVRALSREAARKGRGQETVWNVSCKPTWWDADLNLPWKNPTANPKDTKEVLLQKYEALDRRLRLEGRFPLELEEEAGLWGRGKYKELFLLTSLTSLLDKVTNVHSAVLDSFAKASEIKAEINQSLMNRIETCLSSTLSAIENHKTPAAKESLKRCPPQSLSAGKENGRPAKRKCIRINSSNSEFRQIRPKPTNHKKGSVKKPIHMPLPTSPEACRNELNDSTVRVVPIQSSQASPSAVSLVLQVPQEELNKILQGKIISSSITTHEIPTQPIDYLLGSEIDKNGKMPFNEPEHCSKLKREYCLNNSSSPNSLSPCLSPSNTMYSYSIHSSPSSHATSVSPPQSTSPNTLLESYENSTFPLNSDLPVNTDDTNGVTISSSLNEPVLQNALIGSSISRTGCGRTESSHSQDSLQNSVATTDAGYSSDEGPLLNLDSIFSPDEQTELMNNPGFYLIDRFLEDIDMETLGEDTF